MNAPSPAPNAGCGPTSAAAPALVRRLLCPAAYPHEVSTVRLVETHISWVFLTGSYAYKVKKPVDLGFLDFSSLERRLRCCEEEVRLNRRFAPELYLGVVPIVGPPASARVGAAGQPLEWAVCLRQFDEDQRLDRLLERGSLSAEACGELATQLARVQETLEVAASGTAWGRVAAVAEAIDATLAQLLRHRPDLRPRVDGIDQRLRRMLAARGAVIESRRGSGKVRQCHGDLHLANLVRHGGRFLAFDAIEFSESLRWIDVASDVAFVAMDLRSRGRDDLAATFTSRWIEAADDHRAAAVLPVYLGYRAVVRAAVAAIRGAQASGDGRPAADSVHEADRYVALAEHLVVEPPPMMVVTCGVSGSGKSTLAAAIAAALGGIQLRSDVERKRAAGMEPTDRARDAVALAALYSEASTRRTYARLAALARSLLDAGAVVVVDAACLERRQRRLLAAAAAAAGAPLVWLVLDVPETVVLARVARRQAEGRDASDASIAVVRRQFGRREPLEPDELSAMTGGRFGERIMRLDSRVLDDPSAVRRLAAGLRESPSA